MGHILTAVILAGPWGLALLVECWLTAGPLLAAPVPPGRKLIEWGWDQPDTKFVREHIREMEQTPFDGVILTVVGWDNGQRIDFQWQTWGPRAFTREQFAQAIADLKATRFQKFTDNFLRFDAVPGNVDWFDPEWAAIVQNARLAATIAQEGGLKGWMFDVEQYQGKPFNYKAQKYAERKTFAEYQAQARKRGRELMQAVNEVYPDITILFTFGHSLLRRHADQPENLADASYGLLPAFLDGMIEAATPQTALVDAFEGAYPYKTYDQFLEARRAIRETGRRLSAVPELYDRRLKVGFGVWLDYNWRGIGWRPEEPSKNHFTPEEISHALHNALYASDCYVWLYSEQVNWWTGKGLTPAYIEAVRRCRRDMGLWWRPAPRPQPQPKPQAMLHAKDQPGYDDQTTFGPLWAKYEPVLDLPKTWLFRPDPRRVGEREQWFAPGLDTSAWREIQIGEWWEPQGVAYDGVAWYRVTFTPPAEVAGRRVFLAFGAVDESAWVYLNGQLVGQHDRGEDGWDQRFEIEVTDALRPGRENLLAVRVLDRVAYGGIWKSVKLIAAK